MEGQQHTSVSRKIFKEELLINHCCIWKLMSPLPCPAVTEFPHAYISSSLWFRTGAFPTWPPHVLRALSAKGRGKVTPKEHRDTTAAGRPILAALPRRSRRRPRLRPLRARLRLSPGPSEPAPGPGGAVPVPGRRCSAERAAGSGSGRRAPAPPSPFLLLLPRRRGGLARGSRGVVSCRAVPRVRWTGRC